MKITDIRPQRRNERINIYIDGKFAFGLSEELRFKYDLYIDKEITQDYIDDVLKAEEQNKVLNNAFSILAYRQNSKKEIYAKLMRKGYEEEYVQKAIDFCIEKGFLNDTLYAESFIKDNTNLKKHGSKRIRYDLISKGVSKDIIDDLIDLSYEEEYERALEVANKRIKSYKNDDRNAIYRKLGAYLQRRGYPYDIVSKVLGQVLDELE